MAQGFNVTVDYLLIERAERRPLNAPSTHVDTRLADLDQLTDEERATITAVIDALATKAKLRLITGGASWISLPVRPAARTSRWPSCGVPIRRFPRPRS